MNTACQQLVVLGAGESGVGAALLAKQQGWDVFVSDGGHVADKYREELEAAGIKFESGRHTEARIVSANLVVKSPGIPEKTAIVQALRASGKELIGEIEFGWRYKAAHSKIIAITGSNGKSTTTKLTAHLMREGGLDVAMGGNIGYSFARLLSQPPRDWYVLEVSSFQLDDIAGFRPDVAVLLNITPDHLDRYHYDFNEYIRAKFRITENQTEEDFFILNADDPVITNYRREHAISARKIYFTMNQEQNRQTNQDGAFVHESEMEIRYEGDSMKLPTEDLPISGKHNQYNSMAAGISARIAGIRKQQIRESFTTFEGLEHRLEEVATVRGVRFVNDSKATNINSVWFALESMKQPTILILGGQDKGNDYSELYELVQDKVKAIVCLGLDNQPIRAAFEGRVQELAETQSAEAAVQAAYSLAASGDVVLLSPGCASFDLFKNYEDRGAQFKEAVRAL